MAPFLMKPQPPDTLDVAHGDLAHDDGAQPVAQDDERDRERESESAQYPVDGERHVDDLQVQDLAEIGEAARKELSSPAPPRSP